MNIIFRSLLTAAVFFVNPFISGSVSAATYLIYFDVSSSVRKDHKSYVNEFIQFAERFKSGDQVMILKLDADTLQFRPVRTVVIDKPDPRLSNEVNKKNLGRSKFQTYANIDKVIAEPVLNDETSILGAFVSAGDYYNQEKVPADERMLVIFTDGIEESSRSGIYMRRAIPAMPTQSKLKIPNNLNAHVYMLGIDPKQLPPTGYAAQKAFWEAAVKLSGSELHAFRDKLGKTADITKK